MSAGGSTRYPLVPVVSHELLIEQSEGEPMNRWRFFILERLECGHAVRMTTGLGYRPAVQRRCEGCKNRG